MVGRQIMRLPQPQSLQLLPLPPVEVFVGPKLFARFTPLLGEVTSAPGSKVAVKKTQLQKGSHAPVACVPGVLCVCLRLCDGLCA